MKDNVIYEVVREFMDKEGNMDDFEFLSAFSDYTSALEEANKTEVWRGNQISIWETLDDGDHLDVLNCWLIKEFPE